MKIFVTGSSGSIGAHLVKKLAESGNIVHALVRSIAESQWLKSTNVVLFEGDVLDFKSIQVAMEGCEQVYHLAAMTNVWSKDVGQYFAINVGGTKNVLDAALSLKIQKIVITSTAGVLGPSIRGIVTEDKIRDIDFFNEYESSKAQAESLAKEYIYKEDLNIVFVSPSRVYGPTFHGSPKAVSLLIQKYVDRSWKVFPGIGDEIGNYIFIDDVVNGHILAMEKGRKGHSYILGGENITYRAFFSVISQASGVNRRLYRVPKWIQLFFGWLEVSKAKLLGIPPLVTPKWIRRTFYNWELSMEKSKQELGLEITPINVAMKKTVESFRHFT